MMDERPPNQGPTPVEPAPEAPDPQLEELIRYVRAWATRPWPASKVLSVLIGALFLLEVVCGGTELIPTLTRSGALTRHVLLDLEIWRLGSAMFLHGGIIHVGFSLMITWRVGGSLERMLGTGRFLLLFLASGFAGNLVALAFSLDGVTVGSSGALWGLIAADATLAWRPRGLLPTAILPQARKVAVQNLVLNVIISLLPGVSAAAHAGGGITGLILVGTGLLTWGLLPPDQEPARIPSRLERALVGIPAAGLSAAAGLSVITALAVGRPWEILSPGPDGRVALGRTGFSTLAPEAIRSRESSWLPRLLEELGGAGVDFRDQGTLGDPLRDPVSVEVRVIPLGEGDPVATLQALASAEQGGDAVVPLGSLSEPLGGFSAPTFHQSARGGEGRFTLDRWFQLRPPVVLQMDVLTWGESPEVWEGLGERLVRGLEAEGSPELYFRRALWLLEQGEGLAGLAELDRLIAEAPNARALNQAAWVRATSLDATVRDGAKALEQAKAAVALDGAANVLDTCAAAYAEVGDFEAAVRTQEQALAALAGQEDEEPLREGFQRRLELYRAGQPYREE